MTWKRRIILWSRWRQTDTCEADDTGTGTMYRGGKAIGGTVCVWGGVTYGIRGTIGT